MHIFNKIFFCCGLVLMFSFKNYKNGATNIGKAIHDFNLKNINGQNVSLKDYKNAKGFIIVFTCNHCPFAKLYTQRYNQLSSKYSKLNVPLLAINSMDTLLYEEETFALMQAKASSEHFTFPYLCDGTQSVGKNFGANHTPHAYIIWKEHNNWIIKYSGSIDDNGEHPEKALPLIANAIDELLHNKPVSKSESQSFGCKIFYRKI